jgi:hypothetical protein
MTGREDSSFDCSGKDGGGSKLYGISLCSTERKAKEEEILSVSVENNKEKDARSCSTEGEGKRTKRNGT